ncbi:MAG: OmpA family protein [Hyphomicrobiaceae bacterium]|nr:OmpA family protein [Hyphomicrobiaceae bacterium]
MAFEISRQGRLPAPAAVGSDSRPALSSMRRIVGGAIVSATLALSASVVLAQSREIHLGTVTTRGTADYDAARAAAEMLADALIALEQGDVMLGRRRLEVLVERYPHSLAASSARRELGRIYNDQSVASTYRGGQAPAREPVAPGVRIEPPVRTIEASIESSAQTRQPTDYRRQQALAHDFQTTAGDRVFFADSSTDLGARARTVLVAQARWLSRHADQPVAIEAHADDRGSRELNVELAQRRGAAVRDRLIEEGVAPSRITVRAYGNDQPIATCSAPECAAQNRRVVTSIGLDHDIGEEARDRARPSLATAGRGRIGSSD